MSLLMDALRKAEADKKQGSADENSKLALTSEADPEPGSSPAPPADDSDPSINVSFAETVDLRRATRDIPPPPPEPGAELTLEPLAYQELLDQESVAEADREPPDPAAATNRTSTLPSMRGVEQQLDNYFDDSQASTLAPERVSDPLDDMMAEPVASRESGITETVVSAATVFEAGTSGPSRRVIAWGIVGAALIGVLLIGAGFYYFQQAPTTLALPSPSVALNVEKPLPRELPVIPVTGAPPGALAPAPEPVARVETENAPTLFAGPDPAVVVTGQAATGTPTATTDSAPEPPRTDPPAAATDLAAAATPDIEPAAPASVPSVAGMSLGQLRIARSGPKTSTEPLLNDAYAAYVAGDYAAAESGYAAVLEQQPQRRDALLGMAALKLQNGDVAAAHRMYRDVLKRDPGNATAQAALFTLESRGAENVTEAKLKLLLDEGVDGGYIYFSLGNLYARKQRWPDAQQAYFEALRYHPANPDYNYNLAVSLDRIGQRESAAKYYEAAVDLADSERGGFDPAQALARLQAIAGTGTR